MAMRTLNSHHFYFSEIPLTFLAVLENDLVLKAVKKDQGSNGLQVRTFSALNIYEVLDSCQEWFD